MTTSHFSPSCPFTIPNPVSQQDWLHLTFLHWRYEPAIVQRLLPPGLTVETFDGSAWVGLVPFTMRVGLGPFPPIPYLTVFPETNVRTYVTGPNGNSGVWFFSLDISRLLGVLAVRGSTSVPYIWSRMEHQLRGNIVESHCWRRWPGPAPAWMSMRLRRGRPIQPAELTDLDHFLTARWRLYSQMPGALGTGRVEHAPWPLHHAELLRLDQTLITAAGLPVPEGEPLVRYSPGVHARLSMVHRDRYAL